MVGESRGLRAHHGCGAVFVLYVKIQIKSLRHSEISGTGCSENFLPCRKLSDAQKRFDELSLSTSDHTRKTFEPRTFGNDGFLVEPFSQEAELFGRNLAITNPFEQVIEDRSWHVL